MKPSTANVGAIWGSAPFECIASGTAASHEALVDALQPAPGTRLLDVATGTGPVALLAAARGASVTAVDLAAELLERARASARCAQLEVTFRVADAAALPFASEEFDLVASAQGVVFAPDAVAAARELGRVCRRGGRIGLTCPLAHGFAFELARLLAVFRPHAVEVSLRPFAWGARARVHALLGREFELQFDELAVPFRVAAPEEGWQIYARSFGPLKAVVEELGGAGRSELRTRVVELLRRYESSDGIVAPRPLLLVVGRRRE